MALHQDVRVIYVYIPTFTPLLYSKTGVCRGIPIFLIFFFAQNLDCLHSLEPPRSGGSNVYPQSVFRAKLLKISFLMKILQLKKSVYCMGKFS